MAAEGEEASAPADAASPAAAEQHRKAGSLLTRLLRQLRTVSVRNLAVNNDKNGGSPPLPPSTYIQVLARPPPSSSSSSSTSSSTTKAQFRVYYTSEVASFTHNPTWLVVDLEPLDNHHGENGKDEDDEEGEEEEGEEEGPLPSNLPGEEICIRVFLAPSTDDDDDHNPSSDLITTTTKRRGRRRETNPPHTQRLQRGQHAPLNPSPPLATFFFHLPHLWCLPPTLKLSQLHLPSFPATCLLATGEGGTGLLVEEGVGEGLGLELNGGRREDAPHLLDEQYVEELEEYQHRPSFSASSSSSSSSSSSRTLDGAMGKLTLTSPSSSSSPSPSSSTSQKREDEQSINYLAERARLQALLQRQRRVLAKEQKALAEEEEGLKEEGRVLHALTQRHTSLEREAEEVEEEVMDQEEILLQKEFLVAVRQRKLVGELQRIYPIERRSGEQEYRIRGLELPADVVNTTRDDELVASALGYVSHVIVMLSKYLEVPLRYALECRSSRSLIRDATVEYAVFPLYKRGVERERFEWAVYLLKKDIQQLLCARGVPGALLLGKGGVGGSGGGGGGVGGGMLPEPPYSTHILQNLQALFIHELAPSSTLM